MISGIRSSGYVEPSVTLPEIETVTAPFEHTIRTRIRAELATFNIVLSYPLADVMTGRLNSWHQEFVKEVHKYEDPTAVIERFTQLLQEMLVDELDHAPFEEVSYLGSDGFVYGEKALICYLHRNLFAPLFTVKRHPIVEAAVSWLKRYKKEIEIPASILELNLKLIKEKAIPEIPTDPIRVRNQERAKRIREKLNQKAERVAAAKESTKAKAAAGAKAYVDEVFADIEIDIDSLRRQEEARAREIRAADDAELNAIKLEEAEMKRCNDEIHARIDTLEERLNILSIGLSEAEKRMCCLEEAIAATQSAIDEKNKKDSERAFLEIGKIVVMMGASYATGYAISQPLGGGAMIGTTIPFTL